MDPNWKEFVVVEFIDTSEVATVLNSWIQQNTETFHLECLWPDQTNSVRKALVSGTKPLPTWTTWKIRVLTSCDNFKEALKKERKAQDTSDLGSCVESDAGKGFRVRKRNIRLESSSESEDNMEDDIPPPKLKKPKQSLPANLTPRSSSSSKTTITPRSYFNEEVDGSTGSSLIGAETTPSSKSFSRTFLSGDEKSSSSNNCSHGGACLKLQEQQEKMERTLLLMRMEVKEVLDIVSQMAKAPQSRVLSSLENNSKTKFSQKFPIATLDDFLELEDSLKAEETNNLMVDFFTKIGGSTVEDSVTRSLVRLLTNQVAVNFSWEGRKGKRALNRLSIVQILERVLSATHCTTFTSKIFENRLREWFRQAGTRLANKTKKSIV